MLPHGLVNDGMGRRYKLYFVRIIEIFPGIKASLP